MKNKKVFINRPFFCSEFQSVRRIVEIVHSAMASNQRPRPELLEEINHFITDGRKTGRKSVVASGGLIHNR